CRAPAPGRDSAGSRARQAFRSRGRWWERRNSTCRDTDILRRSAIRLRSGLNSSLEMPRRRMSARMLSTSCSLILKLTYIGAVWTMVASWVGPFAPTSSPGETRRAVTMPSKGAFTSVLGEVELGLRGLSLGLLELGPRGIAVGGCLVKRRLRRNLATRQLGLAFVFRFRLLQCCLDAGLRGPRLLELELVRLRLAYQEGAPFLP